MKDSPTKLPISAIVTGHNEGYILDRCLQSISFCEEIIYVDLESADNSIEIAQQHATRIIPHKKVPIVEIIHAELYHETKYEWILIIDPDEQVSFELYEDIVRLFQGGIPDNIGGILVPWLFYFKKHLLVGTPWGGFNNNRLLIFNKQRYEVTTLVHAGGRIIEPYTAHRISYNGNNADHHYWMNSYKQLFEKHRRYLKHEPESRYKQGIRVGLRKIFTTPLTSFKYAFFDRRGYKDGFTGLFLCSFWSWYQSLSVIYLYRYQNKIKKTETV